MVGLTSCGGPGLDIAAFGQDADGADAAGVCNIFCSYGKQSYADKHNDRR
ncbi:MAG: hypothetical protein SWO11_17780 [Thermodesulfobacteriota bacterium]|nr:hypothetical protein [Thermodesulfobacteriota bacterium]